MNLPIFLISLAPLIVAIIAGLYFFAVWMKGGRRSPPLLSFALGLSLLWWFKLPNILLHAGIPFVQRELYPFLFVSLLAYFAAHLLILRGFSGLRGTREISALWCGVWFFLAVLYFFFSFFVPGADVTYAPVWGSNILFYIPAQLLMLYELRRTAHHHVTTASTWLPGTFIAVAGVSALILSSALYIFVQATSYPRSFWLLSAISSPWIAVLQLMATIFLFLGVRSLTRAYLSGQAA